MLNNLENHKKMSSPVDFNPCNANSNGAKYAENAEHSKFWNAIINKAPFEEIKRFYEAGADINESDSNGFNVLINAVMYNENPEVIKYLINKGLSVKQTYQSEWTITHYAVKNTNPKILKTLLELGAPYDNEKIRELKAFKPLDYSILNDNDELKYYTPLALAAKDGTPEVCEILIKAGARLEARDKEGRTPLMFATLNHNPEVFRLLLKYGADINALDYAKNNVLSHAIANSCLELVKEIAEITKAHFSNNNYNNYIKNGEKAQKLRERVEEDPELLTKLQSVGIDPNYNKGIKYPYIFLAAKNSDLRVLDYLKEQGCDLSLGKEYDSVFIYALQCNSNPEIIDYLIKNNLFVKDVTFAVEYIRYNSNLKAWKRLLEMGLPIDFQDNLGESLLMKYLHSDNPNPDIVSLLINEKTVNLKNIWGCTACHVAAENDDPISLSLLLSNGAKINEKDDKGVTPLMAASGMNSFNPMPNLKSIDFLINNGADISERDSEGNDALLSSMKNPDEDVIKLLIKKGADIHTKNRNGENILMKAIKSIDSNDCINLLLAMEIDFDEKATIDSYVAIIKYIISLGIDVNEKDAVGHPAIAYAAYYNPYPEILELLVQNGADINYLTDKKENLLIIAARNNRSEKLIEYLIDKGFDKNYVTSEGETPILASAQNRNICVLKKLIEKGANFEAIDNNKRNALFIASMCNQNPDVVSFIIDKGIPVNYRDPIGNTAVLYAAQNWNENVIKTLVNKGADLQAVNDNGITALMSAMTVGNNNVEVVKYLVENGIDVNAKDSENITALMYASNCITNPEIIELLITAGADVSDEDVNGYNAYRIAQEYNPNPAIAETIKKYSLINQTKESILNIPTNVN